MKETLPANVKAQIEEMEAKDKEEQNDLLIPTEEMILRLGEIVGDEDAESFKTLTENLQNGTVEQSTILTFQSDFSDKQKRTDCHQFFKRYLKKYESDTLSIGESRRIRVFLKSGVSKNKRTKNNITNWGDKHGLGGIKVPEVLEMALMKTNFESVQAIHFCSKRLKKQVKNFGICGNKDKRGITTQRITLTRGNPEQVIRAQRGRDWDNKVKLGSFKRVWEGV